MVKTRLDITGNRYGMLVVVSPHSQDQYRRWRWNCRCDCDVCTVASSNNLRSGNSKSCGCLNALTSAEIGRRHFSDLRGDKHYRWVADRGSIKHRPSAVKRWSADVIDRNLGGCFKCGSSDRLHAHHADSYASHPERRLDPLNGVPLCSRHHREFHKIYGRDGSTQEQLHEFLGYPQPDRALICAKARRPSNPDLAGIVDLIIAGKLQAALNNIDREIERLKGSAS